MKEAKFASITKRSARPIAATKVADLARSGGRPRTTAAKPAADKRSSPSLSDQVLALASGKTYQEIAAACKGARPNHVGAAISSHKRAGRIEERDGKLYATQSRGTEQRPRSGHRDESDRRPTRKGLRNGRDRLGRYARFLSTETLLNRGTTRKRIRISRRFRRSLDYAPASGRPMRLSSPAGHRRPANPI